MAESSDSMTRRERAFWMLLEKGVLALVLALAGYFFSDQLKRHELVAKYQESLVASRVQNYKQLLAAAEHVRDIAITFYEASPDKAAAADTDKSWQVLLEELSRQARRPAPGPSGGSTSLVTDEDFTQAIHALVDARRKSSLYLSDAVGAAVDNLLKVLTTDLKKDLSRRGARIGRTAWVDRDTARRANDAYVKLREEIRKALQVQNMLIG